MAKEIERSFLSHRRLAATRGQGHQATSGLHRHHGRPLRTRAHSRQQAGTPDHQDPANRPSSATSTNTISHDDARELLTHAIGIVIEKRRFRIPHKGFTWEVDVYEGALEGLTVAEVEMKRETDLPNLPAWLGREITGDRRYSNQALATEGLLEAQT